MQKESFKIMQNLGYPTDTLQTIEKESKASGGVLTKKIVHILKTLGTPDNAIKQIKGIETQARKKQASADQPAPSKNKELIQSLVRRCRRSLDAFAKKGVQARIVFGSKHWVIEAPEYDPAIQRLHDVCKPHFDEWAEEGLNVIFFFDGSKTWQVITKKKSDSPDIE